MNTRRLARDVSLVLAWILAVFAVMNAWRAWHERAPFSLGLDSWAYWGSWREALYAHDPAEPLGRYLYSPAFAEVIRPLTLLPWPVFAVLWSVGVACVYAWLLRPLPWLWRLPLFALLTLEDVLLGNIYAVLALMLVLAVRHPSAWAFALLTKPPLAVGLIWYAVRRDWRSLGTAFATTCAVVLISLPFGVHWWISWVRLLTSDRLQPAASMLPYWVRIVAAVALVVLAARTDRVWLLAVALMIASPMWGSASWGLLAAIPRLMDPNRNAHTPVATADVRFYPSARPLSIPRMFRYP